MKLRYIIGLFILPFLLYAANTTVFDRLLVNTNFQYSATTPGAGKILISDASGNASWTSTSSGLTNLIIGNLVITQNYISNTVTGAHIIIQ